MMILRQRAAARLVDEPALPRVPEVALDYFELQERAALPRAVDDVALQDDEDHHDQEDA